MIEQFKRAWSITKKNLAVYFLRGPVVVFGLVMPAFLFISFILKRQIPAESLVSGLLGMSLFFTVSSITPGIMPWETRMHTLERIISSPVKLWAIILGDIISSFIYGTIITLVIFSISWFFIANVTLNLSIVLGTLLAAFCFSALGELIASVPTDNPSNSMMLSTLIKFPLIFISGIFIPIEEMGDLKWISFFSPLTYYTDLVRGTIQGIAYFPMGIDFLALTIFSFGFFFLSLKMHQKTIPKRL